MEEQNKFTPEIYKKLIKAVDELPKEAVETATSEKTRKGYDTTGYQYQYLINVINEVVGVSGWNYEYKIIKEYEGQWQTVDYQTKQPKTKRFNEITVEVKITILGTSRTCIGGHKAEMYSDALKGAITNGLKKTIAFFGVGKKAYEGTLDEDYQTIPVEPQIYHCETCNKEVKYIAAKVFLAKKLPISCKECFQNKEEDKKSFEKVAIEVENEFKK